MRAALCLVPALLWMACARPDPLATLTVPLPDGSALLVMGTEGSGPQWLHRQGRRTRSLVDPPVALFPVAASPSPDGRYLAVLSVGEGHPVLDLLALPRVLGGSHGERSLRFIDPYPGSIELLGWVGARLRLASDRPLATCCEPSGRIPGDDVAKQPTSFVLDPETGAIGPD
jgi:hypothetical protein